ncbi:AAA family ATPase [Flammeovirga aprica]|uniref:AAA family ATPase n=1 Tax=Flammeovirga aprica JL-4 TaxID=694437 RepID=A0A7X9XCA3_9BACT|nr:ATP-binding protein [Flammeovirga aprica]NME71533.1 AAA family ATPase [Flammeovirga aprica JL-4]
MFNFNNQTIAKKTPKFKNPLELCVNTLVLHIDEYIKQFTNKEESKPSKFSTDLAFYKALLEKFPESHFYALSQKFNLEGQDIAFLTFAYAWEYCDNVFSTFYSEENNSILHYNFKGKRSSNQKKYIPYLNAFLQLYFPENRERMSFYFMDPKHPLIQQKIISFEYLDKESEVLGKLFSVMKLSENFAHYLHGGSYPPLDAEVGFPAKLTQSKLDFDEVVLTEATQESLSPFLTWVKIHKKIRAQKDQPFYKKIKTNKLYVFSGPPGTGKTLTATTIGQKYGLQTYVLEISKVVSKYIGEFEKSMERVFQKLDGQNTILFIDEADSLFTKRSEEISDAKDKYANQEMSYLLQRVEQFDGIVVLATNVRDIRMHFDKAMLRRVSEIIEFGFPLKNERLKLWKNAIAPPFKYATSVVENLAEEFQVTGASIVSAMSNVLIECFDQEIFEIPKDIIEKHLEREYYKRDSRFGICRDDAPPALLVEQRLGRTAVHSGKRM